MTKRNYNSIVATAVALVLATPFAWAEDTAQTDIIRRNSQYAAVQQAVYMLVAEAQDSDADGTVEAPGMEPWTSGGPGTDVGVVPSSSGAPKTDSFGGALAYCAWNNGTSAGAGAGLLAGSNDDNKPTLAVISYGLDNTFQTTCANIAAAVVSGGAIPVAQGDDYVFLMSKGATHSRETLYWKPPVADNAALSVLALDPAKLMVGEVRLNLADNSMNRWTGATWEKVGSGSQNWKDSGLADAFTTGKVAIGQNTIGAEALTVNGGALAALGLKGTGRVGVDIYNGAGTGVNAFLGFDNSTNKLVISSQTGELSIQLGGAERMSVKADGALTLNGTTVFDAARNLTAANGSFTGDVSAASFKIGATTVIDASRNLVNLANGTFSGDIGAAKGTFSGVVSGGAFQVGSDTVIDASRNVNAATYQVGGVTVVDASRNITNAAGGTFSGNVTANSFTMTGTTFTAPGSVSTYGAMSVRGSKNNWSGIHFMDSAGTNTGTLMMATGHSGFYNAAGNAWRWYVDDNGVEHLSNASQLAAVATNGAACTVLGSIARDGANDVYVCK